MFQSSGRESIIIKDYHVSFLPDRSNKATKSYFLHVSSFLFNWKVVRANINSLTKKGQTQTTHGRKRMAVQKPQTVGRCSRRWSIVSSSSLQRGHLLASWNSFFFFQLIHGQQLTPPKLPSEHTYFRGNATIPD